MSESASSREEEILRQVKAVITAVIKDTATPPGLVHPLQDATIEQMRQCLFLISEREQELARAAGREMRMRPRFIDEPRRGPVVVQLDTSRIGGKSEPEDPGQG